MKSTKPVLTMMCGIAGSGKSTLARELAQEINATIFSSDELREEMFGDVNNQDNNTELFHELHKRIKNCLKSGNNAIYDATNISSKRRISFLQELNNIDCAKKCVIMATPYEQCLENNKNRDRQVPEYVIENMYKHWNTPYWFEDWDYIDIHYWPEYTKQKIYDWVSKYMDYSQDNPYHTLTLGQHCFNTAYYFYKNMTNNKLLLSCAAAVHDNGKVFVKKFENAKGEPTNIAHYYNHENIGAYNALFFDYEFNVDVLDISILVNLHMMPYNWERQNNETELKLRRKYYKLWGAETYNNVIMLHEADKAAH